MSLDDFEDITDKLSSLGVVYVLLVTIPNQPVTRSWSNIIDFEGAPIAKGNMEKAFAEHMENVQKRIEES